MNNNVNGGYPPQGMPPNQAPQGMPPNQTPPGMPPNQAPQGMRPNQAPQGGMHPNQAPPGMPPNQTPPGMPPNQPPQGYGQPGYPGAGGPPKKSKKGLIIGLSIGAVAIIAIVVLLVVFLKGGSGAGSSPEDTIHSCMKAVKALDFEKMMDCVDMPPEEKQKALAELDKPEMKAGMEIMKGVIENMEYEILETNDHGDDTATVKVKMKLSFLGQEQESTEDMDLIKKDGKWYIKMSGASLPGLDQLK